MARACATSVAVPPGGCAMPRRSQRVEALAVLGEVDRFGAGPEHRDAGGLERACQLQRRLAAECHHDAGQPAVAVGSLRQRAAHGEDVLDVSGSKKRRSLVS